MFRIIESIPSKNAEPIKQWLAHLGKERIDETFDPGDKSVNISSILSILSLKFSFRNPLYCLYSL